jgi:antitoxin ParD1/3/4
MRTLAKIGHRADVWHMSTMNISLPDSLKSFVDEQVSGRGYSTSSEYVRELIRHDQDRQRLRGLLLEGASSTPTPPLDDAYFDDLREQVRSRQAG